MRLRRIVSCVNMTIIISGQKVISIIMNKILLNHLLFPQYTLSLKVVLCDVEIKFRVMRGVKNKIIMTHLSIIKPMLLSI